LSLPGHEITGYAGDTRAYNANNQWIGYHDGQGHLVAAISSNTMIMATRRLHQIARIAPSRGSGCILDNRLCTIMSLPAVFQELPRFAVDVFSIS
jgi:hypothetical protein